MGDRGPEVGRRVYCSVEAKATNSCDPQTNLVPALLSAWLLNGPLDLICSCYQENLK